MRGTYVTSCKVLLEQHPAHSEYLTTVFVIITTRGASQMLSLLPVLTLTQEKLELPPCQTWPKLFSFFTTICTLEITLHFTDENTEAWKSSSPSFTTSFKKLQHPFLSYYFFDRMSTRYYINCPHIASAFQSWVMGQGLLTHSHCNPVWPFRVHLVLSVHVLSDCHVAEGWGGWGGEGPRQDK